MTTPAHAQAAGTEKKDADQRWFAAAEQALRAITLDAAWQLFCEERVGSIAPGKLADFSIVDRNPLEVEPERLDEIVACETWLGGRPTRFGAA